MKLTHTILALFVTVLALPMTAVGQDEEEPTRLASVDQPIDNIVVTGQKSEAELRRDLWKSEKNFYSLYNSLNDDSEFDVRCTSEARTGSRIKAQVCRPVFLQNAIRVGDVNNVTNMDANPVIAKDMAEFQRKVRALISANPDLKTAANTYGAAQTQFAAASEK